MENYLKEKDPFIAFLKKLLDDIPKMDNNYREAYIDIVEALHPPLADIGQLLKQNIPAKNKFNPDQLSFIGFIHYRMKYDKNSIDESARFVILEAANELREKYING